MAPVPCVESRFFALILGLIVAARHDGLRQIVLIHPCTGKIMRILKDLGLKKIVKSFGILVGLLGKSRHSKIKLLSVSGKICLL